MNYRVVYPMLAPRSRPHARETEAEYFQRLSAQRLGTTQSASTGGDRTEGTARAALARQSRPHGRG